MDWISYVCSSDLGLTDLPIDVSSEEEGIHMTPQENQFLCQVGPSTPMGEVMRRYWLPFALSSDLPHADCDPIRVRHCGQDLVAFRDTDGKVGLLEEYCMHRGVSLAVGRVEDRGLRCRPEEHKSELQSLMRSSNAVSCVTTKQHLL